MRLPFKASLDAKYANQNEKANANALAEYGNISTIDISRITYLAAIDCWGKQIYT